MSKMNEMYFRQPLQYISYRGYALVATNLSVSGQARHIPR